MRSSGGYRNSFPFLQANVNIVLMAMPELEAGCDSVGIQINIQPTNAVVLVATQINHNEK